MKRICVFPGSFDPITLGHEDIVRRAMLLFDEIIIGIGENSEKKYLFPLEKRMKWISNVFSGEKNIRVMNYKGLTIDFCKQNGARFLLRGLRSSSDFEFERSIAQMNQAIAKDIETVFLISRPEYSAMASTLVRDIYRNGGDVSLFLPLGVDL